MSERAKNPVKSARTTLRIVETLRELDGAGVTELSDELGLPKSSVHNYLSTLREEEYVVKQDGEYRVGLRFLGHGDHARERYQLYHVAKPELQKLAEETGELVNLLVEESGWGYYIYQVYGENAVNVAASTGHRVTLHNTALGKSILAHLPEDRRDEIIDEHGFTATTENTITDRETLERELDAVLERGVAFDREEHVQGIRCAAVPVLEESEGVVGAISVAGPSSRLNGDRYEEEIPELLEQASNIIGLNITYG